MQSIIALIGTSLLLSAGLHRDATLVNKKGQGRDPADERCCMRRFLALPIRAHLLLLVCLLTLPALAGIIFMGLDQRRDSFDNSVAETRRLASVIAIQQRNLIANAQQLGNVIAQLPDVKQHNVSAVNKILKEE